MNSQKIAVLTDSGTDVPQDFRELHDIRVIPLRINYSDGTSYASGIDISSEEVIARFSDEIPTTSLPSPQDMVQAFVQAKQDGYEKAVFVGIASGLSATFETARIVAEQMPDFPILVVDSRSIGVAAGMVVMEAARKIEAGTPFSSLAQAMQDVVLNTFVFFSVKSLEYLRHGGRIGEAVYRLGSFLDIKPVITCDVPSDGHYVMTKKARGWTRALLEQAKLIAARAKEMGGSVRCAICCSEATASSFGELEANLRSQVDNMSELIFSGISADLLVHTGPDLVGMAVQLISN